MGSLVPTIRPFTPQPTMYYIEEELSPTDTSEDSIEVSVKPIHKKFTKSKRKSAEPRRVKVHKLEVENGCSSPDYNENDYALKRKSPSHLAPKKRFKLDAMLEMEREKIKLETMETTRNTSTPFRPWLLESEETLPTSTRLQPSPTPSVNCRSSPSPVQHTPATPRHIINNGCSPVLNASPLPLLLSYALRMQSLSNNVPEQDEPLSLVVTKQPETSIKEETVEEDQTVSPHPSNKKQTNYKSMTKDRRVEANARERQRVHTITAAFDTLQAAIPTEEENIKLSKLSVIKIATAYIMALSRMAGYDYTEDRSAPSVESVINHCRQTISTESKLKHRKS